MTHDEALAFLSENQPLPDDSEMEQELIDRWFEVLEFCEAHPDPRWIPLLLGAPSDVACYGWTVLANVLGGYDAATLIDAFRTAFRSPDPVRRYILLDLSGYFPAMPELLPEYLVSLSSEDDFERGASISALRKVVGMNDLRALRDAFAKETDPYNKGELHEMIAKLDA